VTGWTPQRRGFGMVFQNYALFPHLNVFENVAFGLRARKVAEPRVKGRVAEALRIVDLDGYAERAVQALSGGQQQRVALARALAIEPPLLLLDEPLSNLDQALRVRTRTELRALVKKLGITAIFVTHDQEEAFDLSDRIAVMRAGRIRQFGAPRELYDAPVDRFVAGFVGRANTIPVRIEQGAVQLGGGVTWPLPQGVSVPPREAALLFRPEAVTFANGATADARGSDGRVPDALPGVVRAERFRGAVTFYEVEVEAREGLAWDGPDGVGGIDSAGASGAGAGSATTTVFEVASAPGGPRPGTRVGLVPLPDARLHLFPRDCGRDASRDDYEVEDLG
jgi:ABC-type Fe3+/spermidine/putrescine transport system ATPase subunit